MDNSELQKIKQRYNIVGNSDGLNHALDVALQVAPTDLSVLIIGESGVGKEIIPRVIHNNSPRRRELLAGLDVNFEVKVLRGIDESYPEDLDAYDVAEYIAQKKADAYRSLLNGDETSEEVSEDSTSEKSSSDDLLILTADTVVIAPAADEQNDQEGKGIILGKPQNADDAVRMLKMLSGKTHHVVTGVCLTTKKEQRKFSVCTEVSFKEFEEWEINYYITHYKPFDKAGAYGIQEWIGYIGCTGLKGSYFNVMGLPVQRIYAEMLKLAE